MLRNTREGEAEKPMVCEGQGHLIPVVFIWSNVAVASERVTKLILCDGGKERKMDVHFPGWRAEVQEQDSPLLGIHNFMTRKPSSS